MVYLVICLVRDVWLLLKWATSKGADELKPKVEKGAFTKQPTETSISVNFAEIYMLPGPKHKVHFFRDCRGKTAGTDMNAYEICLDCKKKLKKLN